MRILAAGDHFVAPDLFARELAAVLGEDHGHTVAPLTLPWPLTPFGPVSEVDEASGDEDTMIDALGDAEVCLTQMGPVTAKVLASAPSLRLVVVGRGGPVNVNLEAAEEHGVRVCNTPGRNAAATAEYTVAMMLAAMRRVPETSAALASGRWAGEFYTYENCGPGLDGATVGLVGCGAVGSRVARALTAFGARVLVYDPYADAATLRDTGASAVSTLDELLRASDVVSLHARLTAETRGLLGARELALLPDGAVVVNCARGALLDEDALCDGLESGRLAGAALDVFAVEPPPADSRLRTAPRLVMTPHLAGANTAVAHNAARIAAAEVGRYLRGEPLAHRVV
ncbi:2-hydroxyacid dehydrogenase [Streptomyces montanisoli]|uniref:2-hydroxyacid dehydrogenase n=1 Tax=Streptomyces montanisoli TaxID=2798581 RepID=A0A940MFN9_9ACTN|nr:2-hydroxyacid dehydrogenase [Streptomyces montanisoli]MBP0458757.1 2-hydroxyacid dehydrogenase [Streptomyces montanisoli]